VFLSAAGDESAQVELTYNWDAEAYSGGRNFGHLAYEVEDIYATCQRLQDHGVVIQRHLVTANMAFVRSPDQIRSKSCSAGSIASAGAVGVDAQCGQLVVSLKTVLTPAEARWSLV